MPGKISINTQGQGLYDVTDRISNYVAGQALTDGICTIFIQHTSASLLIQESYDPSARVDLEAFLNRLVPELDPMYTHTLEGPDDMPAHIKSALTATQLTIPVMAGRLTLGSWQGIYLWEHRHQSQTRTLVCHLSP